MKWCSLVVMTCTIFFSNAFVFYAQLNSSLVHSDFLPQLLFDRLGLNLVFLASQVFPYCHRQGEHVHVRSFPCVVPQSC